MARNLRTQTYQYLSTYLKKNPVQMMSYILRYGNHSQCVLLTRAAIATVSTQDTITTMGLAHQLESALTTIRSARLRSGKLHIVQAAEANTADSSTSNFSNSLHTHSLRKHVLPSNVRMRKFILTFEPLHYTPKSSRLKNCSI